MKIDFIINIIIVFLDREVRVLLLTGGCNFLTNFADNETLASCVNLH